MKVLELFSGIGGMHYACKEAEKLFPNEFKFEIVAAIDINTSANSVYKYNFPNSQLIERNIQSFGVEEFNQLEPDVLLMSPPCQPFTRTGLQKDLKDPRCTALSYLIHIIPHIKSLKYILIENVKGFEMSESRNLVVKMLESNQFSYQEFLISPTQFGIPNSRTRYYLIAKKNGSLCFRVSNQIITSILELCSTDQTRPIDLSLNHFNLKDILDSVDETCPLYKAYLVPDQSLKKRFKVFDIVCPISTSTNCFTKAYTHYAEGTGSILSNIENISKIDETIIKCKQTLDATNELADESNEEIVLDELRQLNLRYFTPNEVTKLMCFPNTFEFPHTYTDRARYKLLGNSINVYVVSCLVGLLLRK